MTTACADDDDEMEADDSANRTLVYLEGDASMSTYTDKNGQTQSSLNLVQTKVDVLKRPNPVTEEASE
jgi:single-stranded DNA-binding protein